MKGKKMSKRAMVVGLAIIATMAATSTIAFAYNGTNGKNKVIVQEKLTEAVEKNIITQDEADQLEEWINNRPTETIDKMQQANREERLNKLVEDDKITEAEKAEIIAWQDSKPDILQSVGKGEHDLDKLLEDGEITEEQKAEIEAWREQKPEAMKNLVQSGKKSRGSKGVKQAQSD